MSKQKDLVEITTAALWRAFDGNDASIPYKAIYEFLAESEIEFREEAPEIADSISEARSALGDLLAQFEEEEEEIY